VNDHRRSIGLKQLEYNDYIEKIAAKHSSNMASGKVDFGHDGFKKRCTTITKKYGSGETGENVAYGTENVTVSEIVVSWLNSPGHKKNIEGNYSETGIGIAQAKDGTYYYTQIFFRR